MPRKFQFGELSKNSMIGIAISIFIIFVIVVIYIMQSTKITTTPISLSKTTLNMIQITPVDKDTIISGKKLIFSGMISYDTDYLLNISYDYNLLNCDKNVKINIIISCVSRGYNFNFPLEFKAGGAGSISRKNIGLSGSGKNAIPFNSSEKVKVEINISNPKLDKNINIQNLTISATPV